MQPARTAAPPGRRRPGGRTAGASALTLAAACVGVMGPALVAVVTGAVAIPRNDAWEPVRSALALAATGRWSETGFADMAMVGQVVLAQPALAIRPGVSTLGALGVVTATVALAASAAIARRLGGPLAGVAAVGLVVLDASFAVQVAASMTDLTGFAAHQLCLLAGLAALRASGGRAIGWWGAAIAAGVVGASVRESAVAALVALAGAAGVAWWRGDRSWAALVRGVVVVGVVAAAVTWLWVWRRGLAGHQPGLGGFAPQAVPAAVVRAVCQLGLVCSPVLAWWALRRSRLPSWPTLVGGVVMVVAAVMTARADLAAGGFVSRRPLLVGNALTRDGAYGHLVLGGDKPAVLGDVVWAALAVVGVVGAVLLVWMSVEVLRSLRADPPAPGLVAVWLAGAAALAAGPLHVVAGGAAFDRYLWPAVVAVAITAVRAAGVQDMGRVVTSSPARPSRRSLLGVGAATLLIVGLGSVTAVTTVEEASSAAVRWRAGTALAQAGTPPWAIDAGFEWMGTHLRGPVADPDEPVRVAGPAPGYTGFFRGSANCALVRWSSSDDPTLEPLGTVPYRPWPGAAPRLLHVYANPPSCAAADLPVPSPLP